MLAFKHLFPMDLKRQKFADKSHNIVICTYSHNGTQIEFSLSQALS